MLFPAAQCSVGKEYYNGSQERCISALVLPSVLARPSSPGHLDSQITAEDVSSPVISCSHLAFWAF